MSDIVVLCYHAVSRTWPAATSVTPGDLRAQLERFLHRGYHGSTLVDALTAPTAPRIVVVTFDDAHRSVLEIARPVLDALGLPATVFVPTDYAGTQRLMGWAGYERWMATEHAQELRCLSWEELGDLAEGGWEIGSHTCSHPRLTSLDDRALRRELSVSRRICQERLNGPCVSLAYPYADYDDRVLEATRRAGYGLAVTVAAGWAQPLPLRWPRVVVGHGDTARRLQMRLLRRWRAVDTVVRWVRRRTFDTRSPADP